MNKMKTLWGFIKKPQQLTTEIIKEPIPHFREKITLYLELDVDYPVDMNIHNELEKSQYMMKVHDRVTIHSCTLHNSYTTSQAVTKK